MKNHPVILYVEDEARSRKVMRLIVQDMGLSHITIFEDSTDFVSRVTALMPKPDIVFLDIHMKPYSGFEMLPMLRNLEQFKSIPIVAMTASVMNEEINQLRVAGFNGCIAKPIDLDTFPDTLTRILKGESIWRVIA